MKSGKRISVEEKINIIDNNLDKLLKLLRPSCQNKLEVTNVASNFNSLVEIVEESNIECPIRVKTVYDSYLNLIKRVYPEMYIELKKELKKFP